MTDDTNGPKPLSDAEAAQLDLTLALIEDNPDRKITITARLLCAYVLHRERTLEADREKFKDLIREACVQFADYEPDVKVRPGDGQHAHPDPYPVHHTLVKEMRDALPLEFPR